MAKINPTPAGKAPAATHATKTEAKPAATQTSPAKAPKPPEPPVTPADLGGIDIAKLTPEQLAKLQRALKEKNKEKQGDKTERFKMIDTMLAEKDEDSGEFKHTTRDILNALIKEKLVSPEGSEAEQNEIKKIQARKQFLEKSRNEKGELVHKEGTFGYKAHSGGFVTSPAKIVEWFSAENVAKLSAEHKTAIKNALVN